jgi:hypothetical protein
MTLQGPPKRGFIIKGLTAGGDRLCRAALRPTAKFRDECAALWSFT